MAYPLSFIVCILFALRGYLLWKGVVVGEEILLVTFVLFSVFFLWGIKKLFGELLFEKSLFLQWNYHYFPYLACVNLPLKLFSELPAVKGQSTAVMLSWKTDNN